MATAGDRRSFLSDLSWLLALLGAQQVIAVEELQDLVGDPDVDVAAGCGLTEADLLPVDADDADRGRAAGDPVAVAAVAVRAFGAVGARAYRCHFGALFAQEPRCRRVHIQGLMGTAVVV